MSKEYKLTFDGELLRKYRIIALENNIDVEQAIKGALATYSVVKGLLKREGDGAQLAVVDEHFQVKVTIGIP